MLGRFDLALAEAAAGQGSLVLIYGAAGIGKTRLCEQVRQVHRASGGPALLGRAAPGESGIEFGALADACAWPGARSRRCGTPRQRGPTSWARSLPELTSRAADGPRPGG